MTDTVQHQETRPRPGSRDSSAPVALLAPPSRTDDDPTATSTALATRTVEAPAGTPTVAPPRPADDPAGTPTVAPPRRPPAPEPVPAPAPTPEPPPSTGPLEHWFLPLVVLILGMFMSILDTSIVNIAIPSIRQDFGVTAESAQWISTSYALTEGAVVALSVYLGNRYGYKRLYVVSIALFTMFSALCGLSWSLDSMIAFRILQAIPGGMIPVTCTTLIYRIVPRQSIGTAMGIFGLGVVVAPGVGPTLGGYFVEYLSWPWIYWVNVPIGIVSTIAAATILRREVGDRTRPFDALGFLTLAVALGSLLLAFEEGTSWGWTSYRVLGLIFLGTNLVVLWIVIERQVKHPLLDMRVFANKTFLVSLALIMVFMVSLSSMLFYLPQFLQSVQGYSAWEAGLIILPEALVLMVIMPVAGKLYDLIGARWPALVGVLLCGGGMFYLSGINVDMPVSHVITAEMLVAAGMGVGMMPTMTGGLSALSPDLGGSGSALNTLGQRVGQSFGLALLSALITVDKSQFFTDRSDLIDPRGADADPAVQEMVRQGTSGLLGMWQQITGEAQALAYSNAFLITGYCTLAAVAVVFLLPSGRPEPTTGDKPIAH